MSPRKNKIRILLVVLPLIIGGMGYYIYFPNVYFVKGVDSIVPISFHLPYEVHGIWKVLRNYGFDFLWAVAFSAGISFFYNEWKTLIRKGFALVLVLEFGMELIQLFPNITGTFDICDIIVEFVANVLVILLLKERRR